MLVMRMLSLRRDVTGYSPRRAGRVCYLRGALTTHAPARPHAGAGKLVQRSKAGEFVLEGDGLAVIRGERLVFSGLGFRVPEGGALLLIGPNGSGKSTLLRLVAGLVRAEAGRLSWQGTDALADLADHAARVAYLGHLDAVKPGLTVAENLLVWGFRERIARALDTVGLAALADLPAKML